MEMSLAIGTRVINVLIPGVRPLQPSLGFVQFPVASAYKLLKITRSQQNSKVSKLICPERLFPVAIVNNGIGSIPARNSFQRFGVLNHDTYLDGVVFAENVAGSGEFGHFSFILSAEDPSGVNVIRLLG